MNIPKKSKDRPLIQRTSKFLKTKILAILTDYSVVSTLNSKE